MKFGRRVSQRRCDRCRDMVSDTVTMVRVKRGSEQPARSDEQLLCSKPACRQKAEEDGYTVVGLGP